MTVLAAVQTIGQGKAGTGRCFPLTQPRLLCELLRDGESVYVTDVRQRPQSSPLIQTLGSEGVGLVIRDDGVGFDVGELGAGRSSRGLLTMRERAESVGAQFGVESRPGGGTRILVQVSG